MEFKLVIVEEQDFPQYKRDMQEAFQLGFEEVYGKCDQVILPEKDIDNSINTPGAICYKALVDNEMVGGCIVVIDNETNYNHLHILYVKHNVQSKGVGKMIWDNIEVLHPNTKVWETCTPCFEKRNIHFYTNKCGFKITERIDEINEEGFIGDHGEGMYTLKKIY